MTALRYKEATARPPLSRVTLIGSDTSTFSNLVTLFLNETQSNPSHFLEIEREIIAVLRTDESPFEFSPAFSDFLCECFALANGNFPSGVSDSALEILSLLLLRSHVSPELGRLYLEYGFLSLLHLEEFPIHLLETVAAFMAQCQECRDAVLDQSPLSGWLGLIRQRDCRLQLEILHLVSAVVFWPIDQETDMRDTTLIFDHLLQRGSPEIVGETLQVIAVACENQADYCIAVTQTGIVEKMVGFLESHEHCRIISRVFLMLAAKVGISLGFDVLQTLFSFVITGDIEDSCFIQNMCGIVGLSCISELSIELIMRAGGCEVLRIASQEGVFASKVAALRAVHKLARCGSQQQLCCVVDSAILDGVLDCADPANGDLARVVLCTFRDLTEAVLADGSDTRLDMVVAFFQRDEINELRTSEDTTVSELLSEIDGVISSYMSR
jgi:hypothetical protein